MIKQLTNEELYDLTELTENQLAQIDKEKYESLNAHYERMGFKERFVLVNGSWVFVD